MGTMVGDDGGANQIGVAPGAKWIAADALPDGGEHDQALLDAGQWIAGSDEPERATSRKPELRPNIVSNSWGLVR